MSSISPPTKNQQKNFILVHCECIMTFWDQEDSTRTHMDTLKPKNLKFTENIHWERGFLYILDDPGPKCTMAPSDFGRSINPFSTKEGRLWRLSPSNNIGWYRIFWLSYGPDELHENQIILRSTVNDRKCIFTFGQSRKSNTWKYSASDWMPKPKPNVEFLENYYPSAALILLLLMLFW